ncbi:RRQRL motif-containing zinc-binding protein [Streptomyces sp. NPDC102282]|uniref:RRQRL motif-containing zinc-binding protein n=1 Tax=Streptomyces sp. NPDC102282 TaxID=3366154 RepID=UPI003815773B
MPRPRKSRRRGEVVRIPRSEALLPEYDRGAVPEGFVTRRQLREMGLSPGRNVGPVAILRCRWCSYRPQYSCNHPTRGFLLRLDLAKPKRIPTLAQEWALDRAMAARQTCPVPTCRRRYVYALPLRKLGCCLECWDGTPADPANYTAPTGIQHRLAA